MIVDYHTHTDLCKHAEGGPEEYILKAISLGLDEVGCSDHAPMPENYDDRHRMSLDQYYSVYAPAVSELTERYKKRIVVKRGVEVDFLPGTERWVKKFIDENDFDFVIGSVHFIGRLGSEKALFGQDYQEEEVEGLSVEYFGAIEASAESGLFDIIGHCDLVKKFGERSGRRVDEAVRGALKAIKKSDLCIEINTFGLRKPEREMYPSERILEIAKELRIPLTLGSDAHKPADVGADFDRATAMIRKYGNGKFSVFNKRKRREVEISALTPR
jgi:histidinol-phosphatase (PHP family)